MPYRNKEDQRARDQRRSKRTRNPALAAVYAKTWRDRNPEKIAAYRERTRERRAAYKAARKAEYLAIEHARRARKAGNGGSHTKEDIAALLSLQRNHCAVCRSLLASYQIDHIVPLSAGGSNDKTNLQLLCRPCNNSKSSRHPADFMRSRGFLL